MSLEEVKDYSLSDGDIRKILGGNIKIFTYPQLKNIRDINSLFDENGRCMILFLTNSETSGHWCCMLRKKKGIVFFDPYGEAPNDVVDDIPKSRLEELDMTSPYLTRLMKASGLPVFYNTYQYQKLRDGINTCGRWCVVRCFYANKSDEYFHNVIMEAQKDGMSGDDFVAALTANWLRK